MITIPKVKPETVREYDEKQLLDHFNKYARYIRVGYAIYFGGIITAGDTNELYEKFKSIVRKEKKV